MFARRVLKWSCLFLFVFITILYAVRIFIVDVFIVRGQSMDPTFMDGDKVYVNKLILKEKDITYFWSKTIYMF